MAGFIRRFTQFPPLDVITEIEGISIVDLIPPGIFVGRVSGTVLLVGEWPDGPPDTPITVEGDQTIRDVLGGFSLAVTNPLDFTAAPAGEFTNPFSNGNAFCWLKNKRFRRLVLVRVNMDLAEGVNISVTGTVPGGGTVLLSDLVLPAGTRVFDASAPDVEFALARSITIAEGTDLAVSAFTVFDDRASYDTRTIEGVPVFSTRDTPEAVISDVDSTNAEDLFRAGIGAGTALPLVAVAASTGALDGAGANAAVLTPLTSGEIDTAYETAIDTTLPGEPATDNVEIIASARESSAIRTKLLENARDASSEGTGRIALVRPPIGTARAAAVAAADPGAGANRSDRVVYCYPHFEQRIPELATLDPQNLIAPSENILLGGDSAAATVLSQIPPEYNPGQSTQEFQSGGILSFIRALEPGLTTAGQPTKFIRDDYIAFKAAGIFALRRDAQISEWIFQSGVTSIDPVTFPSLVPIKRRRMADFLQDSMAAIAKRFNKQLATSERIDSLIGELTDFLDLMLSETNPAQQRIAAFSIDATSGNTTQLQGSGVFVVIVSVQLLDSLDFIVLQTTIGETVEVAAAA